jgi:NAD-dependent SIR2 family protein deacetylase
MTLMHREAAIHGATHLIRSARYLSTFTGTGISVESGIPPFARSN